MVTRASSEDKNQLRVEKVKEKAFHKSFTKKLPKWSDDGVSQRKKLQKSRSLLSHTAAETVARYHLMGGQTVKANLRRQIHDNVQKSQTRPECGAAKETTKNI